MEVSDHNILPLPESTHDLGSSEDSQISRRPTTLDRAMSLGESSSDEESSVDQLNAKKESAYERVKRMLMAPTNKDNHSRSRLNESQIKATHKHDSAKIPSSLQDDPLQINERTPTLHTERIQDNEAEHTQSSDFEHELPRSESLAIGDTNKLQELDRNSNMDDASFDDREGLPKRLNRRHSESGNSDKLFVSSDEDVDRESYTEKRQQQESSQSSDHKPRNRLQELLARKREELKKLHSKQNQSDESDTESSNSKAESAVDVTRKPRSSNVPELELSPEDDADDEAAKNFTRQARTSRKASKKAMEEMSRETQRMDRSRQLAHQSKTKTKYTTEALFAKFNFRQPAISVVEAVQSEPLSLPNPSSSSTRPSSDVDSDHTKGTLPSSPPSSHGSATSKFSKPALMDEPFLMSGALPVDNPTPASNDIVVKPASGQSATYAVVTPKKEAANIRGRDQNRKVYQAEDLRHLLSKANISAEDDDELEIVQTGFKSRISVLDTVKGNKRTESKSLLQLRALANLNDSSVKGRVKTSKTPAEVATQLRRTARQQAARERDERILKLREKGIVVQSAEEKEREQMQIEDMLEKARKENEALASREKAAARKNGETMGDNLSDEEDDEDDEWNPEAEEIEYSGSDEEDAEGDNGANEEDRDHEEEDEADEKEENEDIATAVIDGEAEADTEKENISDDEPSEAEPTSKGIFQKPAKQRRRVVISDDEDDDQVKTSETNLRTPASAKTPQPSLTDAFGFRKINTTPLGLSQVFAGTMATTQTQMEEPTIADETDEELPDLQKDFAYKNPSVALAESSDPLGLLIQDSQKTPGKADVEAIDGNPVFETQSQTPFDMMQSQIEPSQDVGFQAVPSPMSTPSASHTALEQASYQTIDTVVLPTLGASQTEPTKNKGRLVRHRLSSPGLETADQDDVNENSSTGERAPPKDIFEKMREAALAKKTQQQVWDKKKSAAKQIADEQAEESEDEYAGLGGASDDESDGEVEEELKKLIDDEEKEKVDEREMAAFHANKERELDEKGMEKLYKDVMNGGLRRKRGADMDLLDSDDEDEIQARRRAAKQREFKKRMQALLTDERIGKIAENPKQEAFLRAIQDRDEGDDVDILGLGPDILEDPSQIAQSQSQTQVPDSQMQSNVLAETSGNKRKYSDVVEASQEENRPPQDEAPQSKVRRVTSNAMSKPSNLAALRNTLSELLDDPYRDTAADVSQLLPSDDSESESESSMRDFINDDDEIMQADTDGGKPEQAQQQGPVSEVRARRVPANASRAQVIDRIALRRSASRQDSSNAGQRRLAFQSTSAASNSSFRKPSLLQRASMTNASANTSTSSRENSFSATGGMGGHEDWGKEVVKMGGKTNRASVNYYARDIEKKKVLERVEREKSESRKKVAGMRRTVLGLSSLAGGRFEEIR